MTFRLDRLTQAPIVDKIGNPLMVFQRLWQRTVEKIEAQEAAQDALIADLAATVADLQATIRRDAISASYTVPTLVVSAADAGSNVTITVASHTRNYGDETTTAITGAALTGRAYTTTYAIYYDDPTRAGGAVTFQSTTDLKTGQNNYVAGRHHVGTVLTPAAAGAPTSGGAPPPGSGYSGSGGGGTVIP